MTSGARDLARAALADLLEHPGPGFWNDLDTSLGRLSACDAAAAEQIGQFRDAVRPMRLGELQELYAATFDFRSECSLHAGWHLFGDDRHRGVFLVGLVQRYRARGFSSGRELPDHVPALLRFVSAPGPETDEIVADALLPALAAIRRELEAGGNPYRHVVAAAAVLLGASVDTRPGPGAGPTSLRERAAVHEGG